MPPKAKINKTMILNAVLNITKERGFEAVNARSIAGELQCSTRPVFTCYRNMEELKKEFLLFAYEYYERYVLEYEKTVPVKPYLLFPLSYVEFAREETNLFKLLFVSDMDLEMGEEKDFYKEGDNEKRALDFSEKTGIELQRAKKIFLDLFLYTHGIAVLTASKNIDFGRETTEKMVAGFLRTFTAQEWKKQEKGEEYEEKQRGVHAGEQADKYADKSVYE